MLSAHRVQIIANAEQRRRDENALRARLTEMEASLAVSKQKQAEKRADRLYEQLFGGR